MIIRYFGVSDVGRKRTKNEDSFIAEPSLNLFAVADGMGGHLGGDIASRIAVDTLKETIEALEKDPEMTLPEGGMPFKPGEYQGYLRFALRLASERIFEKAKTEISLKGMGTTTVALLFRNNKVYVANVGDSRAYRVRGENIAQVTKDHSLVGEQMRAGLLSYEEARGHKLKNIITRSVGFQEEVEADIEIRALKVGDRFIICSDGLSNMIKDEEILGVVTTTSCEDACKRLVDIANERGGDDNITVVIAEVEGLDSGKEVPTSDEPTTEQG